jgi:hypothetical protein
VEETRREVAAEAEEARADARHRLERLARAAAEVGRIWRRSMTGLAKRRGAGLRPFDPLAESPLVRRGAARLERQRASAAARDLARRLEEAAEASPWEAAAALLAFFSEVARRPPESLGTPAGWEERWEILRREWPGAPGFADLLARLPRPLRLEVGLRAAGGDVAAGLQLASADLVAGVSLALARAPVAAVARSVLAALGPRVRCRRCRRARLARHVVRTRGLDEVHGLVCPACGALLRSYWRYGDPEGLEALAALAGEVGLVAEQVARLDGISLSFQMLPAARERLTAAGLRALFAELYLAPCGMDLDPARLQVRAHGGVLRPSARVPAAGVRLSLEPGAGLTDAGLVEALRARIDRRFRPGGG